jgi:hypothetical protein
MTQSEANPSLDYGSLLAGKKAGNNAFLGCRRVRVRRKMIVPQAFSTGFPTQENRETRRPKQGSTIDYARKPELWTVRSLESAKAHPLAAAHVKSRKGEALKPTTDADYDE